MNDWISFEDDCPSTGEKVWVYSLKTHQIEIRKFGYLTIETEESDPRWMLWKKIDKPSPPINEKKSHELLVHARKEMQRDDYMGCLMCLMQYLEEKETTEN